MRLGGAGRTRRAAVDESGVTAMRMGNNGRAGRPVIGITGYVERARWDIWHTPATLIQQSYVSKVTESGGRAVVLPPDAVDADIVERLDGLVFSSGADLDPALYGADRHPESDRARVDRDAGELLLLRAAIAADLPVLGVCRGMQLIALAYGGRLHQHLPEVLGHDRHCPTVGVLAEHEVRFAAGSLAARLMGPRVVTNSHHHQGVADAGGLLVSGRTDDGLAEAVEDPARRFLLGVQWHPEAAPDNRLFAALVAACAPERAPVGGLPD